MRKRSAGNDSSLSTSCQEDCEHHFGSPASRIVYKSSGRTNYVFVLNHVEGQFVVRISPEPEKINAFRKELWTSQKVREVGVPSPEVIELDSGFIERLRIRPW